MQRAAGVLAGIMTTMTRFRDMITSFESELTSEEIAFSRRRATGWIRLWGAEPEEEDTGFSFHSSTLRMLRSQNISLVNRKKLLITMWHLATSYKEKLPPELWDAFLEDYSWNPALASDLVERERQRAWERRRHLVAGWDAAE